MVVIQQVKWWLSSKELQGRCWSKDRRFQLDKRIKF